MKMLSLSCHHSTKQHRSIPGFEIVLPFLAVLAAPKFRCLDTFVVDV